MARSRGDELDGQRRPAASALRASAASQPDRRRDVVPWGRHGQARGRRAGRGGHRAQRGEPAAGDHRQGHGHRGLAAREEVVKPAARRLAEWAEGLAAGDVPPVVMDNAALRVLDTIGCALAGSREEHVPGMLGLVSRWQGAGDSTIWGSSRTAAPPQAALVNGALAHGLDFDDTHADAVCHVSAVLTPTVLAMAGSEQLSGRDALTAFVAGSEGMIRLGMAAPDASTLEAGMPRRYAACSAPRSRPASASASTPTGSPRRSGSRQAWPPA